jgi:hypothetical protein
MAEWWCIVFSDNVRKVAVAWIMEDREPQRLHLKTLKPSESTK